MKKLMAGNWKMYKTAMQAGTEAHALAELLKNILPVDREVLIIPPFTGIQAVAAGLSSSGVQIGGQNFYPANEGAFTGEISPEMLLDLGCAYALVGHSERRHILGEDNAFIGRKTVFGLQAGLKIILCVGETLEEREAGHLKKVVGAQIEAGLAGLSKVEADSIAIAYEPVWAIGTGKVAGPAEILEAHAFIRERLGRVLPNMAASMRILYGGSVKPDNAGQIIALDNVDGVLVGGASLQAESFSRIVLA